MAQQIKYPATVDKHPDYDDTIEPLEEVRDCVVGAWRIKQEGIKYLKHPSDTDTTSDAAQVRYAAYKDNAEFDDFVNLTLRGWIGKMRIADTTIETPDRLNYLIQNADGDGTPLVTAIESAVSNAFQTKYHILLADYQGLSDVELTELSRADAAELSPRATIKQYTRESLVDWDFRRINGVMQLAYMKLKEWSYDFNPETEERTLVETDLILGLDSEGNYYQKKVVGGQSGERDYVTVNGGQPLKWIPAQIVCDEPLPVGALPRGMGMLYPISQLALYRYRISAAYKEMLNGLPPTIFTKGWQPMDQDTFEEINGRGNIALGPKCVNNLPGNVEFDILSPDSKDEAFLKYFEDNANKVRALGGIFKDKPKSTRTATEADMEASEQNASLTSVAQQSEAAWRRVIAYCGMFENLWTQDDIEQNLEQIVVDMPRDFATPKFTREEVQAVYDGITQGVYTREQAVTLLAQNGWGTGEDVETWIAALESELPPISRTPTPQQREVDTGQTS